MKVVKVSLFLVVLREKQSNATRNLENNRDDT